jgi:hypothetical protein
VGCGFFFSSLFVTLLLFGIFCYFLFILKGEGGMSFFSFFSILELGKWVWVLLFHIFLFF